VSSRPERIRIHIDAVSKGFAGEQQAFVPAWSASVGSFRSPPRPKGMATR
jgi:hypothetical protein